MPMDGAGAAEVMDDRERPMPMDGAGAAEVMDDRERPMFMDEQASGKSHGRSKLPELKDFKNKFKSATEFV